MMEWMVKFVPGIRVPGEIQERIRKAKETGGKEAVYEADIDIFVELMRGIMKKTTATGIHAMAVGFDWIIPKIIERAGL